MGTVADGFDLDGVTSTGAGRTCVDFSPDYTSPTGDVGVDNAYGSFLPQVGALVGDGCPPGVPSGECSGALLARAQERGDFQLAVRIDRLETLPNDAEVGVSLWRGRGRVSSATYEQIAAGTGTVFDGQLRVNFPGIVPAWIAVDGGTAMFGGDSVSTSLGGQLSCGGLDGSTIGGGWRVADAAAEAERMMPGLAATISSVLGGNADLEPQAADPTICDSLSWAIRFDTSVPLDPFSL